MPNYSIKHKTIQYPQKAKYLRISPKVLFWIFCSFFLFFSEGASCTGAELTANTYLKNKIRKRNKYIDISVCVCPVYRIIYTYCTSSAQRGIIFRAAMTEATKLLPVLAPLHSKVLYLPPDVSSEWVDWGGDRCCECGSYFCQHWSGEVSYRCKSFPSKPLILPGVTTQACFLFCFGFFFFRPARHKIKPTFHPIAERSELVVKWKTISEIMVNHTV